MPADGAPLRVVHVNFQHDVRGREPDALLDAWPTLSGVAEAVAGAGVDIRVINAARHSATLTRRGVSYDFVDDRTVVADRVAAFAPDVVHVHGFNEGRAVHRLCTRLRGTPVLLQDHGAVPPRSLRRMAWTWAYRPVAAAAFTAHEQAHPFVEARVLRADLPVFEILESSTHFTPGDQRRARAESGLYGQPCLLWVGRLTGDKDPLTMLAAVEQAAALLPDLHLWCCFSEAPLLAEVEARIARSSLLASRVSLLGARPHAELERYYRAADLFIQTSRRESTSYALLEAMACGTTPIVADIPAARRIVGSVGSVTPVGDAAATGRAIVDRTVRDGSERRRDVRARFDDALTFDMIGRELRDAYETMARAR